MRKEIDRYNFTYFFILIIFLISCGKLSNQKKIGYISYDTLIDEPGFVVCNDKRILEYYNFSNAIRFVGEKPEIDKHIKQHVEFTPKFSENGYITIRFVVNCKGQAGRFRVIQLDSTYKEKHFEPVLTQQILAATKSLNGWDLGQKDGAVYDYNQYLTFKIVNGRIKNILP